MKTLNFKMQAAFLVIGLALSANSQAAKPHDAHHDKGWDAAHHNKTHDGNWAEHHDGNWAEHHDNRWVEPHPAMRGWTGPVDHWTGYNFGVYFGAGAGDVHSSFSSHREVFTNSPSSTSSFVDVDLFVEDINGHFSGNVSGSVANLFVGYNYYLPCYNILFGGQVEGTIFSDITFKSRGTSTNFNTDTDIILFEDVDVATADINFEAFNTVQSDQLVDRLHSQVAFVARIGYTFNPCTLVYGLAGPVEGHFVLPASFDAENNFGGRRNQWELGYTVGAGVEYKVAEHWSLRGEYRYLSFDYDRHLHTQTNTTTVSLGTGGSPTAPIPEAPEFTFVSDSFTQKVSHKFRDHLGLIGVVYSF